MNPSFEAFVDPPDGFHDTPGTPSNREGNFSPPEARMAGEPRMQLFAPSAQPIFGFGRRKTAVFRSA